MANLLYELEIIRVVEIVREFKFARTFCPVKPDRRRQFSLRSSRPLRH
jgi:hypothetical protein